MTTLSTFPLLRLPIVALRVVFDQFPLEVLVFLTVYYPKLCQWRLIVGKRYNLRDLVVSTSSEKSWIGFDVFGKYELPVLNHKLQRFHAITNLHQRTTAPFPERTVNIGIDGERFDCTDNAFNTYWKDVMIGIITFTDHVCNMFKVDVQILTIQKSTMWALDWIQLKRSAPLRQLIIYNDEEKEKKLTEEDVRGILTNSRCTAYSLAIEVDFPEKLKINYTPSKFKALKIKYGSWLTLENLYILGETCQEIVIIGSQFTVKDLEAIMNHWLSGRLSRLRCLSIDRVKGYLGLPFSRIFKKYIKKLDRKLFYEW
ncbi:hypothetical protein CAEBREN_08357 [Caenorhabditis brenneri]|uniref:Sdz-33 F-box domain-containing protein n=1 Tax=Caenorhabditis brenneri TaxID=135651 RepID=G0MQC1_CAEBE|nr:hypothetical protein CAEBREN_08357 [Caenorhabditis brenneri]